jgi:hypothetical protein
VGIRSPRSKRRHCLMVAPTRENVPAFLACVSGAAAA